MLATLGQEKKRSWSQHVASLVHAYNSTKSDATGYSPYYLMFGREARLPIDLCFQTSKDGNAEKSHSQYVENLRRDLQRAYELASQAADKTHQRNKRAYDQKVSFQNIEIGDRVLLKNLGVKGKHKLESRWNSLPHVVVRKLPNLPVFQVKPEGSRGSVKTIHRDHILPIGQSVRIPEWQDSDEAPVGPRTRSTRRKKNNLRWYQEHRHQPKETKNQTQPNLTLMWSVSSPIDHTGSTWNAFCREELLGGPLGVHSMKMPENVVPRKPLMSENPTEKTLL